MFSWCSPSDFAKEFAAEKSLAVSEYGCVPTSKWAPGIAWKKARSRWIRSRHSVFRISLQSWRASRVSLVSSICSRSLSMVKAKISIWFGFTTCLHALSGEVSASLPEEGVSGPIRNAVLALFLPQCLGDLFYFSPNSKQIATPHLSDLFFCISAPHQLQRHVEPFPPAFPAIAPS